MSDKPEFGLKGYNANKVIAAVKAFHTHVEEFDEVANSITRISDSVEKIWQGTAADMFVEKYETVYGQVIDISDALYEIYDMLQQAQDTFYQADESLRVSYSDTSGGGSSGGEKVDRGYKDMTTIAEVPHDVAEAYVPNIALPPMQPHSVPVSTMGESYHPAFFYDAFTQLPVVAHSVPSPLIISLLYENKSVKEIIKHNVGDAAQAVFSYDAKSLQEVVPHDVPEAVRPGFAYDAMAPQPVEEHDVPEAAQPAFTYDAMTTQPVVPHDVPAPYEPVFTYEQMSPIPMEHEKIGDAFFSWLMKLRPKAKKRLMDAIAVAVIAAMTEGVLTGRSIEEAKRKIGEIVVKMLKPDDGLTDAMRELLVKMLGQTVFGAVCGQAADMNAAMHELTEAAGLELNDQAINQAIHKIMDGTVPPEMTELLISPAIGILAHKVEFPPIVGPGGQAPTLDELIKEWDLFKFGKVTTVNPAINTVVGPGGTVEPLIRASLMLGETGAKGVRASDMATRLEDISQFSLRMAAMRTLGKGVDLSGLRNTAGSETIPIVSLTPSLQETRLSFSNGEFSWNVREDLAPLNSAVISFCEQPASISGDQAQLLRHATLQSMEVTGLKVPEINLAV